jgi:hypothetical protein
MIRLYTASKMTHAAMWRQLRLVYTNIHFTARWPYLETEIPSTPEHAKIFWQDDLLDVSVADAVLCYAEEGEHLRGALVEAGIALGLGKKVIVVGDHPDYGTWQYHPKVIRSNRRFENQKENLTAILGTLNITGGF